MSDLRSNEEPIDPREWFVSGSWIGAPVSSVEAESITLCRSERQAEEIVRDHNALAAEVTRLRTDRDELQRKLDALREHTLDSNPALRALHSQAVAHIDALAALREVRGGAPCSTTIGWLIRQGYLVPSDRPNGALEETQRELSRTRRELTAETAAARAEVSQLRDKIERVEALIENRDARMTGYDRGLVRAALAEPLGSTEDPPADGTRS